MNGAAQCTAKAAGDSSRERRRGHNKEAIGSAGFERGGNGRARTAISVLLGERRIQGREYERTAERQAKKADRAYWAGLSSDLRRLFLRLRFAFEQVREMGEGGEGLRLILLPARRRFIRRSSSQIPLVFIVVTVEAESLPVTPVGRIVVVIVVLVMDREQTHLLVVEFAPAVRTNPLLRPPILDPSSAASVCGLVLSGFSGYPLPYGVEALHNHRP